MTTDPTGYIIDEQAATALNCRRSQTGYHMAFDFATFLTTVPAILGSPAGSYSRSPRRRQVRGRLHDREGAGLPVVERRASQMTG